jgi:hypothetical protein
MDFITLLSLTEPDDLIAVNQDANKPTTPNPQWPYNITTGGTSTTGGTANYDWYCDRWNMDKPTNSWQYYTDYING